MEPLRITFQLGSQMVVPSVPLHLDGLLAFGRVQEALQADKLESFDIQHDLTDAIEKAEEDGEWIWKASQIHLITDSNSITQSRFKVRRDSACETVPYYANGTLPTKKNGSYLVMNSASGMYKDYFVTYCARFYPSAIAFCIGNASRIRDLLGHLNGLGQMTSNGYGKINEILIERDESAMTRWRERSLPESFANSCLPNHIASVIRPRPPYWERRTSQRGFAFAPDIQIN